jgi:4-alpha-glucanotransferase
MRAAAVLLPLSSLRRRDDLGRGEIPALGDLMVWLDRIGHRVLQLLPLCESAPGENSPYNALSVFALDPLLIGTGELAGVTPQAYAQARAQVGRRRSLSRRESWVIKGPLLAAAFAHFERHADPRARAEFAAYLEAERDWLEDYALFRALKEKLQWRAWESWPTALARRERDALDGARRELARPIAMYQYWQFLAACQWRALADRRRALAVRISGDLAFCPARDSADVWANQAQFRLDRCVGAPPDAFSPQGQRWGLPLPDWSAMVQDDFRWWRRRARHAASLYDLARIDHVVGFYRTYHYACDKPEAPGLFTPANTEAQRTQGERFIAMLKQEMGTGALIAEDLGAVPQWVKDSLGELEIPGLKVFRWEREHWGTTEERLISPAQYPHLAVATTGTHDTEPLAQWWREASLGERQKVRLAFNFPPRHPEASRLDQQELDAILRPLYLSPACLAMIPMQDLFGWTGRVNRPGTISQRNWRYRLPVALEDFSGGAMEARAAQLRQLAPLGRRD